MTEYVEAVKYCAEHAEDRAWRAAWGRAVRWARSVLARHSV